MAAVHYPGLLRVPECSAAGGRSSAASRAAAGPLRLPDQAEEEWLRRSILPLSPGPPRGCGRRYRRHPTHKAAPMHQPAFITALLKHLNS